MASYERVIDIHVDSVNNRAVQIMCVTGEKAHKINVKNLYYFYFMGVLFGALR